MRRASLALTILIALAAPPAALAQTDYYNTDAGRPIRVEDAYPVERRAFELQLAPLDSSARAAPIVGASSLRLLSESSRAPMSRSAFRSRSSTRR